MGRLQGSARNWAVVFDLAQSASDQIFVVL